VIGYVDERGLKFEQGIDALINGTDAFSFDGWENLKGKQGLALVLAQVVDDFHFGGQKYLN
jgi:hypothetical protein